MPETDTHREDIFLRKLMNKANIGWWEADVKTEGDYQTSETYFG